MLKKGLDPNPTSRRPGLLLDHLLDRAGLGNSLMAMKSVTMAMRTLVAAVSAWRVRAGWDCSEPRACSSVPVRPGLGVRFRGSQPLAVARRSVLAGLLTLAAGGVQAEDEVDMYVWPKEPAVQASLKRWQGYKFGVLIHEGLYSHLGRVESWELCPEDWVERHGYDDYYTFARDYRNTKAVFNPVAFDPDKWAAAFKGSGARYVIYTTKHHDGFCLFDSRYTDFKVTDPGCPFSTHARANMAREVFGACRRQGLAVGAYFSKPDWSTPFFWWPYYPPKDRNPNYDITRHKQRWGRFVEYTQNQINELVSDYGPLDILWLDGCWVRPLKTINKHVEEFCKYPHDLDIDLGKVVAAARQKYPGLLVVDRWVPGEFENYLTPEQKTPEKALPVPWESCITMGNAWGWVPRDRFKPTRDLVQLLVRIVAKGGNLLLGVGPDGKGEFDPVVYERLSDIGRWLEANGEAIYDTVPIEPFQEGNVAYTAKSDSVVFAIYMPAKGETGLPETLRLRLKPGATARVTLLSNRQAVETEAVADGLQVRLPGPLRTALAAQPAVVFRVER
jgi:alpha-L-fucosidase